MKKGTKSKEHDKKVLEGHSAMVSVLNAFYDALSKIPEKDRFLIGISAVNFLVNMWYRPTLDVSQNGKYKGDLNV